MPRTSRKKKDPGGRPRLRAGSALTVLLLVRISPGLNKALVARMRAENKKLPMKERMTRSETAREILRGELLVPLKRSA